MSNTATGAQSVGVVIRTLNEAQLIQECLGSLMKQHGGFDLDVVVVDSGSTDGTVELATRRGARIVEMPAATFDYSASLNLGIERARGEFLVSLSAHAIPLDEHWLERMIAPFSDARVAGVTGRQVPWPGAPWKEVERLANLFGESSFTYPPASTEELVFSNAASAIRRSAWREEPFTLPAVEDLDWARRVLDAGWTVAYEAGAVVYHSHDEAPRDQARRLVDIARAHSGAPRTRRRTLREAAGLAYRDARAILGLNASPRRKIGYLAELAQTAVLYVSEFSKAGSTAERRGADSAG